MNLNILSDDRRTLRIANELHHAFPQFTVAQISAVVEVEITADATAVKLIEMDVSKMPTLSNGTPLHQGGFCLTSEQGMAAGSWNP